MGGGVSPHNPMHVIKTRGFQSAMHLVHLCLYSTAGNAFLIAARVESVGIMDAELIVVSVSEARSAMTMVNVSRTSPNVLEVHSSIHVGPSKTNSGRLSPVADPLRHYVTFRKTWPSAGR
jgi:hypothetical protein